MKDYRNFVGSTGIEIFSTVSDFSENFNLHGVVITEKVTIVREKVSIFGIEFLEPMSFLHSPFTSSLPPSSLLLFTHSPLHPSYLKLVQNGRTRTVKEVDHFRDYGSRGDAIFVQGKASNHVTCESVITWCKKGEGRNGEWVKGKYQWLLRNPSK